MMTSLRSRQNQEPPAWPSDGANVPAAKGKGDGARARSIDMYGQQGPTYGQRAASVGAFKRRSNLSSENTHGRLEYYTSRMGTIFCRNEARRYGAAVTKRRWVKFSDVLQPCGIEARRRLGPHNKVNADNLWIYMIRLRSQGPVVCRYAHGRPLWVRAWKHRDGIQLEANTVDLPLRALTDHPLDRGTTHYAQHVRERMDKYGRSASAPS